MLEVIERTVTIKDRLSLDELAPRVMKVAGGVGVVALACAAALGVAVGDGGRRFLFSYLVAFAFVLSLALGGLFFVLLQHVTRSGWSTTVRRIAELIAGALPVVALLMAPIVFSVLAGHDALYRWVAPDPSDHLIIAKAGFLNGPFFVVRWVGYFAVWITLARFFLKRSAQQDRTGDWMLTVSLERVSGPGLIVFALTITFAAFDLLMSLEPHWYSTIFGVYYFSGSTLGIIAAMILVALWLQRRGIASTSITIEHYHDLGKLLFAFVFFWGYIAFSQFMLIWYANIPEETQWYQQRMHGGWAVVSLLLLFGHFVLPFLGLISRHAKRNMKPLVFWACFLLLMHWVDLYWLVMPSYDAHAVRLHLLDLTSVLGCVGLFVAGVAFNARKRLVVAVRDPRVREAVAFENI